MDRQVITSPAGERLVVLPEADYHRLLDAAELLTDLAVARRFRERYNDQDEELVPSPVAFSLVFGHNPVAVWRNYRGMSAKQLSKEADIAAMYLSNIEHDKRPPTAETLEMIADALNLSAADLAR